MYYSTLPDHLKPRIKRREPSIFACFAEVLPMRELVLAGLFLIGFYAIG